jgi:hypothetical protein
MVTKRNRLIPVIPFLLLVASCASVRVQENIGASTEATAESYAKNQSLMGTVLLDARWARHWNCGKYENAQLVSFAFDQMPLANRPDDEKQDLVVGTTSMLAVEPKFVSYALLVTPGEYALSSFKIKVASSVHDVGYWVAKRSDLIRNGKPHAGSFKVAAGETVYIGNFALDCFQNPSLWRYYSESKEDFQKQLGDYKAKYPFIDLSGVKYRLFETDVIGRAHELK